MTYCHSDCFDKNEHQGKLEDLVGDTNVKD